MTIQIYKKGRDLLLESKFVCLKITSDRKLWIQRNWKGENQHTDSGVKLPMGLSRSQKEMWLMEFRKKMIERQGELVKRAPDHRIPSMSVTLDDDDEDEEVEEEDDNELEEKEEPLEEEQK